VAKLTAIGIIIGGGLYYIGLGMIFFKNTNYGSLFFFLLKNYAGYTENLEIGFEGSATSFGQIATAFYGGLWAYSGW
jgi:L-type amino acid transporter 9